MASSDSIEEFIKQDTNFRVTEYGNFYDIDASEQAVCVFLGPMKENGQLGIRKNTGKFEITLIGQEVQINNADILGTGLDPGEEMRLNYTDGSWIATEVQV